MFWIGKALGLLKLGKGIAEARLFQSLLSGLTAVVGFIVIAAMVTGALLLLALYGGYKYMLTLGVEPFMAAVIIGGIMLLAILVLVSYAQCYLRKLCELPRQFREIESPVSGYVQSVAESFKQGFNGIELNRKRRR